MDYREQAKDLLVHRNEYVAARESLKNEIALLTAEKYAAAAVVGDAKADKDGGSKYENYMINLITLIDEAKFRMQVVERKLRQISSGFSALDDYERDLLNAYFVYRIKTPCELMMKKHQKDEHGILKDKLAALEKFTRGVYGIVQT